MSKRLKHPTRRLPSLAFEALEPRALLAAVADWWEDVGQWAPPAWWSEESWWDDSSWWSDQTPATDWPAEEPAGLGDEGELVDTVDLVPGTAEAGIPEAEELDADSSTSLVADDAAGTPSEEETSIQGDDPQVWAPDDPPERGQVVIADDQDENTDDAFCAEPDVITDIVAADVESPRGDIDEGVTMTLVTDKFEAADATSATSATAAGVVEDIAPPAPVQAEPVGTPLAGPVAEGIGDEVDGHVVPHLDEQAGVVTAVGADFGTPVVAVAGIPVTAGVAVEPASPRAAGISSAAIAARRLAMWAGLMGPVAVSGLGGAAGGGGESSPGVIGLTTALPVAGRPRSRLSGRRVG